MAQIKRDHGGYYSSGLWIKFQQPDTSINDDPKRKSKKKDTVKWCKGKVGVKHHFYQTLWKSRWSDHVYYNTECSVCKKEVYKKRIKSLPLHYEIQQESKIYPVQVKVDGVAVPINHLAWTHYWCGGCKEWHYQG